MSDLRVLPAGRLWRCDVCGRVDPWQDGWEWYGSLAAEGVREAMTVTCSAACRKNAAPVLEERRDDADRHARMVRREDAHLRAHPDDERLPGGSW